MPSTAPSPSARPPRTYPRLVRLGTLEWVGIPLLATLPLLSCVGALGPGDAHQSTQVSLPPGTLELAVEYPARLRHSTKGELLATVRNTGDGAVQGLVLGLDAAYLRELVPTDEGPAPVGLRRQAQRVELPLPPLRPGESATLRLRVLAESWGRVSGGVELGRADGGPALARLDLRTLVLP